VDVEWHEWLRRRRLVTDSTIDSYERDIQRLERFAGVRRDDLSLRHVEDFLRNGYSPATKERTFVAFRMRHRWGAIKGRWELDLELMEMRIRKHRAHVRPALTSEQARSLLGLASSPVQIRASHLGLLAGLRLAGMVAVTEREWQGDIIDLTVKGGYEHYIPVHPLLAARREEILSETPTRKQVQDTLRKLRSAIGSPLSAQWLRRTFDQRLRRLGVEASVRKALIGHSPTSVEDQHYAAPTWEELVDAMKCLDYGG
jgi:site-specific recombinase XerD